MVPIGFAVVPGKDVIKDGLVISDVANDTEDVGNQFVWIPVDDMSTFVREAGYVRGNLQSATNGVIDFEKCEEPYNQATLGERQEYENMMASVEEYHGFYIGRYEISKSEDGAGKAQSKKDARAEPPGKPRSQEWSPSSMKEKMTWLEKQEASHRGGAITG